MQDATFLSQRIGVGMPIAAIDVRSRVSAKQRISLRRIAALPDGRKRYRRCQRPGGLSRRLGRSRANVIGFHVNATYRLALTEEIGIAKTRGDRTAHFFGPGLALCKHLWWVIVSIANPIRLSVPYRSDEIHLIGL